MAVPKRRCPLGTVLGENTIARLTLIRISSLSSQKKYFLRCAGEDWRIMAKRAGGASGGASSIAAH
eukprot:scaffold9185_cov107-Skeletonema_marinoi.AAC.2